MCLLKSQNVRESGTESEMMMLISYRSPPPLLPPPQLSTSTRRSGKIVCGSNSKSRKAILIAKRKERIRLPDYTDGHGRPLHITEFLAHPSGVEALLNTSALQSFQSLDSNTYRCTVQKIRFLNFEVIPVIDLRVVQTSRDCMVEMLACKFEGSEKLEQQNHHFSAALMTNHITWDSEGSEPSLEVDVNLRITLEVFTKLLPIAAVEKPGNLVMQSLIDRLVPLLAERLLTDYRMWVEQQALLASYSS